jgi:hypothetical protein
MWDGMTSPSLDTTLMTTTMVGKIWWNHWEDLSVKRTATGYFSGHLLILCEVFRIWEKDDGSVRRGAWRLSMLLELSVDSYFLECVRLFLIMLLNICSWDSASRKNYLKRRTGMPWWSFESVPEITLPPCSIVLLPKLTKIWVWDPGSKRHRIHYPGSGSATLDFSLILPSVIILIFTKVISQMIPSNENAIVV